MLGLGEKQVCVEALLRHQLIVCALFHDLALLYNEDSVRHFDGGQPVAD